MNTFASRFNCRNRRVRHFSPHVHALFLFVCAFFALIRDKPPRAASAVCGDRYDGGERSQPRAHLSRVGRHTNECVPLEVHCYLTSVVRHSVHINRAAEICDSSVCVRVRVWVYVIWSARAPTTKCECVRVRICFSFAVEATASTLNIAYVYIDEFAMIWVSETRAPAERKIMSRASVVD